MTRRGSSRMYPEQIRGLRRYFGITQRDLADHIGIRSMTVSEWERGMKRPSPYCARILVRLLDAVDKGAPSYGQWEHVTPERSSD